MQKSRNTWLAAVLAVAGLAPAASAALIFDTEPNNTLATASAIVRVRGLQFADVGVASLGGAGGDVDVFSIPLALGEVITIITTPLAVPDFDIPDTELAFASPAGIILDQNDDAGGENPVGDLGRGSAIRFQAPVTGTYFIGVTGFDDINADSGAIGQPFAAHVNGSHTQSGSYALTVSVVPEPASLAVLGGLALLGLRRRR